MTANCIVHACMWIAPHARSGSSVRPLRLALRALQRCRVKMTKVAMIVTVYQEWSHGDALGTKFLAGTSTDEGFFTPDVTVVSMYIDHILQTVDGVDPNDRPNPGWAADVGCALANQHDVTVYPSIRQALLNGGSELGVDAVVIIAEHGDYPWNEKGRHMYPRRYFFEQVAGVIAESRRSIPVFTDKHFAYSWADAVWMWERANELSIPLMAGSCLPVGAWRRPFLEHPKEQLSLVEAIAVGYGRGGPVGSKGGSFEASPDGFHTLEALQCMVERRRGGESGVASVQCIEGEEVWLARDAGRWSADLAEAACNAIVGHPEGCWVEFVKDPAAILVEYTDGFRATILFIDGFASSWAYAARVVDADAPATHVPPSRIEACEFFLQPGGNAASFSYQCRNIQRFFKEGLTSVPPERTLLTTGIVDAMMQSRWSGHKLIRTPDLANLAYSSFDVAPIRPTTEWPCGKSLVRNAPDLILPWPDDDPDGHGGLTWAGYEGTWREQGATFRSLRTKMPRL